ncbi:MAG TPA: NAD-dependent epimerase/dehydratase family protein [Patescibacteria group bacterium]|nr:NAD-dependent epimerase/dehydratase family protein [Patescibacteria group bacterium]
MKLVNKNILVTGGAGFIGSHFVEAIAKTNTVTVYDNFSSAVIIPTELTDFGVSDVIKGDILDGIKLEKAMQGIDVVFHFAVACVRLSLSQERHVHDVNATGTLNTLLAAKRAGIKRFVYISSSEVYGTADGGRMNESHPINPTTVYGMSKYVGELYTKHFNDMQGLPTLIVRPFNTYGPRSHFEGVYGEVIPRFVVRTLNGKQPIIFGSGKQTRDFTYVTDTVSGIMKAFQSDRLIGDAINIARGQEISILDIAKTICNETHLPFSPLMKPPRPNDVMRHFADIAKAKKLLLFSPKIPIEKGLHEYVEWVKKTFPQPEKLLRLVPDTNW